MELFNITKFRRQAYAKLWLAWGASYAVQLPGNTEMLLRDARGTVLEVGAGSGELLHLYQEKQIQVIYGVEPAEDLHPRLEERAKVTGFAKERYVILNCGAEPKELVPVLATSGLLNPQDSEGLFDTIVCVRVLCMVPELNETVRLFHSWLKPGGKLIVCEHGANDWKRDEGSIMSRALQCVLMTVGWSLFMGDCHLDRRMEQILVEGARDGGRWAEIKLETVDAWALLPYTVGYLVK
jgi:SAM-dependent methyltransferase